MKIALITASTQLERNRILEKELQKIAKENSHELVNLGVFSDEQETYSYVQIAIAVTILLNSRAVDFVVTGCSSGNGMMLACNALPGVTCGYAATPAEAFLFGRINAGNAISLPLGLNDGWSSDLTFRLILEQLFIEPFGKGYPQEESARKQADTANLRTLKAISQRNLIDVLKEIDPELLKPIIRRKAFRAFIEENGRDKEINDFLTQENQCIW